MKKNLLLFKVFGIFALALSVLSCNKNTITASFQPTKQIDYFASKNTAKATISTATTNDQISTPFAEIHEQTTTEVVQNPDTKTEITQKEEQNTEVKPEENPKTPTLITKNKEAKKSLLANRANGEEFDGLSIGGFICGISGFLLLFAGGGVLSPILFILGIVFGGIGLSRTNKGNKKGKGFAIASLVLGILGIALFLVVLIAILLYISLLL
jgi:hypothetical protein